MKKLLIILLFAISCINYSEMYNFTTLENPPLTYRDGDEIKGFLIDVLDEVAKRQGDEFLYEFCPWKRALYCAEIGTTDGVFNAGDNFIRRQYLIYPEEVLIDEKFCLFIKKGSKIDFGTNYEKVKNYSIGTQLGYTYGDFDKFVNEFKKIEAVRSIMLNIKMLDRGRIDMFIGDLVPTLYYLKQQNLEDKVEILRDGNGEVVVISISPTYLAFSKLREMEGFKLKFDKTLEAIKEDGTYNEILKKYIKKID